MSMQPVLHSFAYRRNGAIALAIGGVVAGTTRGGLILWPAATLLALWPSLGGHYVEVGFLNGLRPWLPAARAVQAVARVAVWFAGGVVLLLTMRATAGLLHPGRPAPWPAWGGAGLAFVGIELVAHLVLLCRGRPSCYDGRG